MQAEANKGEGKRMKESEENNKQSNSALPHLFHLLVLASSPLLPSPHFSAPRHAFISISPLVSRCDIQPFRQLLRPLFVSTLQYCNLFRARGVRHSQPSEFQNETFCTRGPHVDANFGIHEHDRRRFLLVIFAFVDRIRFPDEITKLATRVILLALLCCILTSFTGCLFMHRTFCRVRIDADSFDLLKHKSYIYT